MAIRNKWIIYVLWLIAVVMLDKTIGQSTKDHLITTDGNAGASQDGYTSTSDMTTTSAYVTVPSENSTTSVDIKHLTTSVGSLSKATGDYQTTKSPSGPVFTESSSLSAGPITRALKTSSEPLSTRTTTTTEAPQPSINAASTTSRTTTTTTAPFPGEATTTPTNADDSVTTDVVFSTISSGSTSPASSFSTTFVQSYPTGSASSSNGGVIAVAVIVPVIAIIGISVAVWYFKFKYRKGGTSFTDLQMT